MTILMVIYFAYCVASGVTLSALLGGHSAFWPCLIALSCLNGIGGGLLSRVLQA